jgi:hypothetical protein
LMIVIWVIPKERRVSTAVKMPRHYAHANTHHHKKIFAYLLSFTTTAGLVQQPDKIVVRFAHTIYPYSLG